MLEEDFRAKLADDASVAALVPLASIAWGERPQAGKLPAITLDIVAGSEAQHMEGTQGLQRTLVQADVWSLDRLAARDVRNAVIAAALPPGTTGETRFDRAFVTDKVSSYEQLDSGPIIYRERIDFALWSAAAV